MKKIFLPFLAILMAFVLLGCAKYGVAPVTEPEPEPTAPAFVPVAEPEPEGAAPLVYKDLVTLTAPRAGDVVSSPLQITGEARGNWYFEASFPAELRDADGNLLAGAIVEAQSDWMTEDYVPFAATLIFETTASEGELILKKSNPSGLPENDDELRVPVKFADSAERTELNVYFNNEVLDPEFTCTKVFPVTRSVAKTDAPAKAALEELLKGATEAEKAEKYSTALNEGVMLKSVTIENGVAKADFDEQLGFQVGGSCRVTAIRAQIEETLKQFSTVSEVQISINGVGDDMILQP